MGALVTLVMCRAEFVGALLAAPLRVNPLLHC